MPSIDYNNLTTIQATNLKESLRYLVDDLSFFSNLEKRDVNYYVDGNVIKVDGYNIVVTPEFEPYPAPGGYQSTNLISRHKLMVIVPESVRPVGAKTIFYYMTTSGDKLAAKIFSLIDQYGDSIKVKELGDEYTESEFQKLKNEALARKTKMEDLKIKSQETYERFMKLLDTSKVTVVSTIEDEAINIVLPNNVRMRLNVAGESVNVRDVEFPKDFNFENATDFISTLNNLTKI